MHSLSIVRSEGKKLSIIVVDHNEIIYIIIITYYYYLYFKSIFLLKINATFKQFVRNHF